MSYSDITLDHFRNPRLLGRLSRNDGQFVTFWAKAEVCDDTISFDVRVLGHILESIRFRAYGCPPVLAAASWLAERCQGVDASQVLVISSGDVSRGLLFEPQYEHAADLVVRGLQGAVQVALDATGGSGSG